MKKTSVAIAVAAIALSACSPSPTIEVESEGEFGPPPGATTIPASDPSAEAAGPVVVTLGQAYDIPCSYVNTDTCMTVKFTEIREDEPCELYGSNLKKDQAIALGVEVAMPAGADPEFTSPFRSSPWSTYSSTDQFQRVQNEFCGNDAGALDLMAEFPGGNASAIVYLDAPADVRAVVFEPNDADTYLIETGQ